MKNIKNTWSKLSIYFLVISAFLFVVNIWIPTDPTLAIVFGIFAFGSILTISSQKARTKSLHSFLPNASLALIVSAVFLSTLELWFDIYYPKLLPSCWILAISTSIHNMIFLADVEKKIKNITNSIIFTLSAFSIGNILGIIVNDDFSEKVLTTLVVLSIFSLSTVGILHWRNRSMKNV